MQEIVERYLATFNETDPTRRRALLEQVYTSDATYIDPHHDLSGIDAIDAALGQMQESNPGLVFALRGAVDSHHDQARFQWSAGTAEQPVALLGFDVIATSDGQIERVYGFAEPDLAA
jgi:hypothetical protein